MSVRQAPKTNAPPKDESLGGAEIKTNNRQNRMVLVTVQDCGDLMR